MSGVLLAVAVALIGLTITALWFGVSRRRKAETEIGVHSLANLKWRDCVAVVVEALHRDGFLQAVDSAAKGGGDTEVLLTKDDEKVLLGYKHGTAYHLSEANVREFVNALHMRGARRGILVTLGSTTNAAIDVAKTHDVQLMDGSECWQKVRPFVHPQLLDRVRQEAAAKTRHGLWAGVLGSFLAGGLVYAAGIYLQPQPANAGSVASTAVVAAPAHPTAGVEDGANPAAATAQMPRSDEEMLKQINATARAMAEVAKLSPHELAERRVEAAKAIALFPQVDNAIWTAQRTLLVTLNKSDGKDKALVEELCRSLTQYEELRFTRVQLESPPGAGFPVRWRLCN